MTFLCWKTRQGSLAYSKRSDDTDCFMSLTYIRKSTGPTIDPLGRTHEIFLNIYFQCLLRMPDQSNMNEINWQYRHKNQLLLIFLAVYYGRWYQIPFENLSVSYHKKRQLSKVFKKFSFKYERHESVECFVLKRDWYLYRMLHWAR